MHATAASCGPLLPSGKHAAALSLHACPEHALQRSATVLLTAAACALQDDYLQMVEELCDPVYPQAAAMIQQADSQGLTPLGQAVSWNYLDCVRIMLASLE